MPAFITLSQTGWLLPIVLGLIAVAALLIWSYRTAWSENPRFRAAAVIKFLAIAVLAICLTEPLWSSQRVRPGANLFLLVTDNSQSLQLTDPDAIATRGEQLQRFLTNDEAPWHVRLEQDFEVRRYQFDAQPKYVADFAGLDFSGDRSEIRSVLQTLGDRLKDRPVAGLFLFTDGVATDELTSVDWSGLPPIYPVPIGETEGHRDLSIADVQTTTTAFEDAPVTMVVELAAAGIPSGPITVQVEDQTGTVVKSEMQTLAGDGKSPVFRFQLRPIQSGVTFYRVRAAIGEGEAAFDQRDQAGEVTLANNDRWVTIDRGTGPYRLLYVSGRPNWELKFLRRAIEDDDQLQMTSIIRIAKKEAKFDFRGRDGESSNPLFRGFDRTNEETERYDQPVLVRLNTVTPDEFRDGFPKTAEELYQFHAVILDDIEAQFFSAEQLSLIERFVSERGGGCLMLGGQESFKQGGFDKTALARLLPAYLTSPPVLPPETGYRLSLTKEGWLQPWARLRSTEADEVRRLREMAGFRVINTVSGLKPGASVIAEVTDARGTQFPAVVEQRYGQGRAAALLIGDFWRWQLEVTEKQREQDDLGKAWRQLLRWLIVDVPDRVELKSVADATSGVSLTRLEARVRDDEFHAQDNAAVTVTVHPPEGPDFTLTAEPWLREPGLYEATLASRPSGPWTAKVEVKDPEGQALGSTTTGWSADLTARELRQVQPDRKFLKQLAESTGGQIVELANLESFVSTLPNKQAPITETTTSPLWHHPAVLLLIIAGLCAEWGLRRRSGLP
ncbi:hypothetical protein GC163_15580 [bacterium]|nr:hypothetical protein [bacterium]